MSLSRFSMMLATLAVVGCSGASPEGAPREAAPATLGLFDLNDDAFVLNFAKAGTVVVFTRTDCPIANRATPEWRALVQEWTPKGVTFHLVYVDPREPVSAIRQHLTEYDLPGVPLRDPEHTLVKQCGATTTPEAVLFGRDGVIRYQGPLTSTYRAVGQPDAAPVRRHLHEALLAVSKNEPVAVSRLKAAGCLIADLKD